MKPTHSRRSRWPLNWMKPPTRPPFSFIAQSLICFCLSLPVNTLLSTTHAQTLCQEALTLLNTPASIGQIDRLKARFLPGDALKKIFPLRPTVIAELKVQLANLLSLSLSELGRRQSLGLLKQSLLATEVVGNEPIKLEAQRLIRATMLAMAEKSSEGDKAALALELTSGAFGQLPELEAGKLSRLTEGLESSHTKNDPTPSASGLVQLQVGGDGYSALAVWDLNEREPFKALKQGSAAWTQKAQMGLLMATTMIRNVLSRLPADTPPSSPPAAPSTDSGLQTPVRFTNFESELSQAFRMMTSVARSFGDQSRQVRAGQLNPNAGERIAQIVGYQAFARPEEIKVEVQAQWKWLVEQNLQLSSAAQMMVRGFQTRFDGGNAYEVVDFERKAALRSLITILSRPEGLARNDLGHNYWQDAGYALRELIEPQDVELVLPLLLLYNSIVISNAPSTQELSGSIRNILEQMFGFRLTEFNIKSIPIFTPEDGQLTDLISENLMNYLRPFLAIREQRDREFRQRSQPPL